MTPKKIPVTGKFSDITGLSKRLDPTKDKTKSEAHNESNLKDEPKTFDKVLG